jgi:hypothetical protein
MTMKSFEVNKLLNNNMTYPTLAYEYITEKKFKIKLFTTTKRHFIFM